MPYEKRTYREYSTTPGLVSFTVAVQQTDLFISAPEDLSVEAKKASQDARRIIESYIKSHSEFLSALKPLSFDDQAHELIQKMLKASSASGVGPMAAVAGAVAEFVGTELLKHCDEVIVENGGDIFFKISREITVGIFAGESPLSERVGMKVIPGPNPFGICSSSGKIGHSLSFGKADVVTVKSPSTPRADAAATAIGNLIKDPSDIQKGIKTAQQISDITGIIIIKGKHLGVWGEIEIVSL
jgi:ApbE superfamily uncharacterized protein (UPF0280 family)